MVRTAQSLDDLNLNPRQLRFYFACNHFSSSCPDIYRPVRALRSAIVRLLLGRYEPAVVGRVALAPVNPIDL